MKQKVLFFFTASYPYDNDESFIEYEMPFLSKHFERIVIVTNNKGSENVRPLPKHVEVLSFSYDLKWYEKIRALKNIFCKNYLSEIKHIRNNLKLKAGFKIKKTILTSLYKAEKLSRFIERMLPDNSRIYLYSYWMNDMAVGCAFLKAKHPETHFISRCHGWDLYFERHNPPYLPLRSFISENSNNLHFVSVQGLNYFIQKNRITETQHLVVSYLGTKISEKLNVLNTEDTFHILSCSSVIPLKQLHKIASSLSLIKSEKKIKWTHIGGGENINELKQHTEDLFSSNPHLSFSFTGYMPNEEVHGFYAAHYVNLFINASKFEGLPVSIMEAFSYGIPAVAPNIGGIAEIIDHEKNGLLLSGNPDVEDMAKAVSAFLEMTDEQYSTMREAAFIKWQKHFNAENNMADFCKYFE